MRQLRDNGSYLRPATGASRTAIDAINKVRPQERLSCIPIRTGTSRKRQLWTAQGLDEITTNEERFWYQVDFKDCGSMAVCMISELNLQF
jgi:hypothetical protein